MRRRLTCLLLLVSLSVLGAACGLGDKQEFAKRIHGSRAKAIAAKSASGTLTVEMAPDPDNPAPVQQEGGAEAALLAQAQGAQKWTASFNVDFDFTKRHAQLSLLSSEGGLGEQAPPAEQPAGEQALPAEQPAGDQPATPVSLAGAGAGTLFANDTIFVRRANLRPTEKRLWAKLDFTRLPGDEPRPQPEELEGLQAVIAAANTVNPIFFLDLALGALAGSIEPAGREDVAGVPTSKYEGNMSIERVFTELDLGDTELEARQLMLRLLLNRGVDVRPAQYWVDDDGLLRKARFEFSQRVDRNENNDLVITLELPNYGEPKTIAYPTNDETVEVERYGRMVRASMPRAG